jgi:hypothetical protein
MTSLYAIFRADGEFLTGGRVRAASHAEALVEFAQATSLPMPDGYYAVCEQPDSYDTICAAQGTVKVLRLTHNPVPAYTATVA